jgi:Glyoxalase/Bleomycin resistance protein/Dioxygenase superfamily
MMAGDVEATFAFCRDGFGGEVACDGEFAGARNVLIRVGAGRLHLYDQPPKSVGQGTVHHIGVQTDELKAVVNRLRALGVSVTDIRHELAASYAMAEEPDRVLVEIFQPNPAACRQSFATTSRSRSEDRARAVCAPASCRPGRVRERCHGACSGRIGARPSRLAAHALRGLLRGNKHRLVVIAGTNEDVSEEPGACARKAQDGVGQAR